MNMMELEEERAELASTLLAAMAEGADRIWSDERFNALALRVLRYQARANPAYGALLRYRAISPSRLTEWEDAPWVPTRAFRELPLASTSPAPPEAVFRTSGTSMGGQTRGEHRVRDLSLYRASLLPTARRFLRPDLPPHREAGEASSQGGGQGGGQGAAGLAGGSTPGADREEPALRILSLTPCPADLPDSSLAFMIGTFAEAWDDGAGGYFARSDWSLDVGALRQAIGQAWEEDQPVMIAGTAFAYVHWLDAVRSSPPPPLPEGSRALETGGYKGRSRRVPRQELHREIASVHGLGPDLIVNEYGMTELLSQFYEPMLVQGQVRGHEAPGHVLMDFAPGGVGWREVNERLLADGGPPGLLGPPWIRTRILDPVSLKDVRAGEPGLLAHFDLANLDSVSAVLTEDLGVQVREGFRVLGRVAGSEPRGCSLAMEDLLTAREQVP